MPMRQTIGISLVLFVISAGAIAKTPEKSASHHHGQPHSPNSGKGAETHAGKTRSASARVAHTRSSLRSASHHATSARHRHQTSQFVAQADGPGPDTYWPTGHATGTPEIGKAAWYARVGAFTSSGERLDTVTATAAHRSLPLASFAKVTNLDSGRSVIVKINDRGPQNRRFIIDLSPRAADELEMRHAGVAPVIVEPVAFGPVPIDHAVPAVAIVSTGLSQ
jgi:rare lipoprotein A